MSYGGNPSKVTQFAYYDGSTAVSSVSLLYGNHYTKVTDNVGRYGIYQFNNYGNTVSVYNQEGQAMYGSFATDESSNGRANQLRRSSRLQDTVVNLLSTRDRSGSWTETIAVQGGKYYTLSGCGTGDSTLTMTAGSTSRTVTTQSGETRTELSIQIPNGVTSLTISGSGNYNQLQFEQAESSSRYNLLENTDMDSSSFWAWTNLSSGDGITTRSGTRAQLNSSALVLTGGAATTKRYYQTISNLNGVAGDDYSFGAWVQSGSVPLTNVNTPGASTTRRCGIEVRLLNESTVVNSKYIAANPACHEWQFLSGSVRATGTYNAVEFSYVYDYNGNNSYFDGAQLFKEKFSYIYDYDSQNRVQTITDLEGRVTTYAYRGTSSDITSIQLPGGESYSYTYNSTSNLLATASTPLGVTTTYTYDSYGNPTKAEISHSNYARKLVSQTTYTSDGNMTATVTGNDGNTVSYSNDTDLSLVTSATDPKGAVTQNSYDVMRRPTQSQVGSSAVTNTYADDLLTSLSHTNTSSASTTYSLSYTTGEQLYQVKVGSAYTLVQNSYNSGTWTLQSQNYGNGAAWVYEYNSFDQVTRRYTTNGSTGLEFLYFYNSEGKLGRIEQYSTTLSGGSITSRTLVATERYYYDTSDRLIRVQETDASNNRHEFRWSYNSNDQVTELVETLNGKSFTYTNSYNNDQQPSQSSYGNALKSFTYDGLGRLSQSAVSSGNSAVLTTAYTYRDWGTANTTTQVATLSNSYGSANTPTSESFSYTYDANGNIASVTYGSNTTIYEYDALNELVWEKNAAASKAWEYSYDLGGNILSKKEYDYQNGVVGSTPLSTITYTYGDASWPDLLTAYNGSPITYDGIGNPTSYRGWSFTWQGGRQLASASDGTTSLSFAYNESGLRTGKTVGSATHRYIYRGSLLVAEIASNYALYFHHDANGEIVGFTYSANDTDTEYFYRKNLQGDVVGIVDAAGSSAAKYTYDAWGNILSATDTMANVNPIRYRGYYYDTETGLYYLQSRYYDPEVGRFINADAFASTGQGILAANMFAYCWNNPVNHVDYDGGLPKWAGIIAGAAAGIAIAAAAVALAPAAMCAVTFALTWYGVGYTTAAAISAIGVSAIAANATIYAMDAGYSAATNESPVLNMMGNNTAAYNTWRAVTEFSMYGYVAAARQGMLWSVCFVSGTLIATETGPAPIESIKKGDLVWSWDEETGRVELKPVVETYINECNELIHLTIGDEEIVCTPNHPFYIPQKGWTAAVRLRAGDILVTVNGEYVVLEKVQHELLEAPVAVYNFQVEGYHTYYVGVSKICVHNSCMPKNLTPTGGGRAAAFNQAKKDLGIPISQQPIRVLPNIDRRGNVVPGRVYDFGNGLYIRDDAAGHMFSDGVNLPPHFNTTNGGHYFY